MPSPWRSGTSVTTPGRTSPAIPVGAGQVAVGHDDMADAAVAQRLDAGVDRAVEPLARMPQHRRAVCGGPLGDLVVVAGDVHRQLTGRGDHPFGRPARQARPLLAVEHSGEAALRLAERLDGHEHDRVHGEHGRGAVTAHAV